MARLEISSPALEQTKEMDGSSQTSADSSKLQSLKDTYRTYINPRVGLAVTAIALVGGVIMSSALIAAGGVGIAESAVPGLTLALGKGATDAAVTAYITGVMGSFGCLWFLNFPRIATDLQDFTGRLLSGELLGRTWEPQKSKEPTFSLQTANIDPEFGDLSHNITLDKPADICTHFRDKLTAEFMQQPRLERTTPLR